MPVQVFRATSFWMATFFVAFVYLVILWYAAAWIVVRFRPIRMWAGKVVRGLPRWIRWLPARARSIVFSWLVDLAARRTSRSQRIVAGVVLLALAATLLICDVFLANSLDRLVPLGDLGITPLIALLVVGALWTFVLAIRTSTTPYDGATGLVGRLLAFVFLMTIIGEAIWVMALAIPSIVSYRVFTVWAIFHVAFLILSLATVIDVWHEDWHWPVRELAVLFVAMYVGTEIFLKPDPAGEAVAASSPTPRDWYATLEDRIDAAADWPLILVAASGGGSRAAAFTALVYEALRAEPLLDGAGKTVLLSAGHGREKATNASWADQVIVISSVSGGSLATAYHVRDGQPRQQLPLSGLRNSFGAGLQSQADEMARGKLREIYEESWLKDSRYAQTSEFRAKADAAIKATPSRQFDGWPWIVQSSFVDDMFTDFMAPLLRGLMTPTGQRGVALGRFWEQKFGWERCDNLRGYADQAYGDGPTKAPAPLALFNVTDARRGLRHIISFPPLPPGVFNENPKRVLTAEDLLPDGPEFHTLSLADFDSHYRITLGEAARLSANFPWGVRSSRLATRGGTVDLVDGGVNDNTGIASLAEVMDHLNRLAGPPKGPTENATTPAERIMKALRRRGVVLIEIDSGAKPSVTPVGELRTPAQGLENAAQANAIEAKNWHLQHMAEVLAPRLGSRVPALMDLVESKREYGYMGYKKFTCNHTDAEVMTAWSLPPTDKARILATFFWEYRQWTEIELQAGFNQWLLAWQAQAEYTDHPGLAASLPQPWLEGVQVLQLDNAPTKNERATSVRNKPLPTAWRAQQATQQYRQAEMAKIGSKGG
jgi:hypothetical protein